MNGKTLALSALATTLLLSGCISDTRVAAGPVRANAVVAAPPPRPVVIAEPVYVPEPHDAYISVALDNDIVFVGGNTYIWYVGHDGRRYRHFYGRGDLRGEVLHRRSNLRLVMAHHEGHLPMQKVPMPPPERHGMRAHAGRTPQEQREHREQHAHQPPQMHQSQQAHQPHQPPSGKPASAANHTADADRRWQPRT